jgi:hypothetical protein
VSHLDAYAVSCTGCGGLPEPQWADCSVELHAGAGIARYPLCYACVILWGPGCIASLVPFDGDLPLDVLAFLDPVEAEARAMLDRWKP